MKRGYLIGFIFSLILGIIFISLLRVAETQTVYRPVRLTDGTLYLLGLSPTQHGTLNNSRNVSSPANTAVRITLSSAPNERVHVYRVESRCAAGTAPTQIESPSGTILFDNNPSASALYDFGTGFTGNTNVDVVVELGACGVGNNGILMIQSDRF